MSKSTSPSHLIPAVLVTLDVRHVPTLGCERVSELMCGVVIAPTHRRIVLGHRQGNRARGLSAEEPGAREDVRLADLVDEVRGFPARCW